MVLTIGIILSFHCIRSNMLLFSQQKRGGLCDPVFIHANRDFFFLEAEVHVNGLTSMSLADILPVTLHM